VTSGIWGDSASKSAKDDVHDLSAHLRFSQHLKQFQMGKKTDLTEASGWWGSISKTTDAGKTWETVFESKPEDVYYFNGISCSSESHCVAVAEGDDYTGCKAFVTFDGGVTWEDTLTSSGAVPTNAVSLMSVDWVSETEGWLAGTAKNGRTLTGLFYKTVDGGKTYKIEQVIKNYIIFLQRND
jgi:photosystem II stability/assembly factor-like uncharacterized protein